MAGLAKWVDYAYLLIGHQNAISYKEIFKLIKGNKIWLGYGFVGGAGHFISDYKDEAVAGSHKEGMVRVSGVNWFTNLDIEKRHEDLLLFKKYNKEEYPKLDNYNAINVEKTKYIPEGYGGAMAVPITFMDKFNPDQFKIIDGIGRYSFLDGPTPTTRGKYLTQMGSERKYARIVIKHKRKSRK